VLQPLRFFVFFFPPATLFPLFPFRRSFFPPLPLPCSTPEENGVGVFSFWVKRIFFFLEVPSFEQGRGPLRSAVPFPKGYSRQLKSFHQYMSGSFSFSLFFFISFPEACCFLLRLSFSIAPMAFINKDHAGFLPVPFSPFSFPGFFFFHCYNQASRPSVSWRLIRGE